MAPAISDASAWIAGSREQRPWTCLLGSLAPGGSDTSGARPSPSLMGPLCAGLGRGMDGPPLPAAQVLLSQAHSLAQCCPPGAPPHPRGPPGLTGVRGRGRALIRLQAGAPEALTDRGPSGRVDVGLSPRRPEETDGGGRRPVPVSGWVCRAPGQETRGPGHTGLRTGWAVVTSPERRPFGVWKKTWACVWACVLGARGGHGKLPPGSVPRFLSHRTCREGDLALRDVPSGGHGARSPSHALLLDAGRGSVQLRQREPGL